MTKDSYKHMIEARKKVQARLEGTPFMAMPDSELTSAQELFQKSVAITESVGTSLLERASSDPIEFLDLLSSDSFFARKLENLKRQIRAFEQAGLDEESTKAKRKYSTEWNNHFLYKHLANLIPQEVLPSFRVWQKASNTISRASEDFDHYLQIKAQYIASALSHLRKQYPDGNNNFDFAKLIDRFHIIAKDFIPDASYTSPIQVTTKPLESFSNILPLIGEFEQMGLKPGEQKPFYHLSTSGWFVIPRPIVNVFERTLAELLMAETCLGPNLGVYNTSCVELKKFLRNYDDLPQEITTTINAQSRRRDLAAEYQRAEVGIYEVTASLGAFEDKRKTLEKIALVSKI